MVLIFALVFPHPHTHTQSHARAHTPSVLAFYYGECIPSVRGFCCRLLPSGSVVSSVSNEVSPQLPSHPPFSLPLPGWRTKRAGSIPANRGPGATGSPQASTAVPCSHSMEIKTRARPRGERANPPPRRQGVQYPPPSLRFPSTLDRPSPWVGGGGRVYAQAKTFTKLNAFENKAQIFIPRPLVGECKPDAHRRFQHAGPPPWVAGLGSSTKQGPGGDHHVVGVRKPEAVVPQARPQRPRPSRPRPRVHRHPEGGGIPTTQLKQMD